MSQVGSKTFGQESMVESRDRQYWHHESTVENDYRDATLWHEREQSGRDDAWSEEYLKSHRE